MTTCGTRINLIDKDDKNADFPMCDAEESWEHVILCDKIKK